MNSPYRRTVPLLALLLAAAPARADYPLVSYRYLADPGSVVSNGTVYLCCSNDDDNPVGGGYTMHSIVCVSTTDMKNWTDLGVVFSVPANASWAQYSWAPQPVQRDGTIYLYFGNNASGVGVASSSSPAGIFKDAHGGYLVNGSTAGVATGGWLFDPGALIDDDGAAYLSFGGNGQQYARIIQLGSTLTSVSGSAVAIDPPNFFEASFLFKRNGTYYFSYSDISNIAYMTSSSPMSGYAYKGIIAANPPANNGNNNHASEFEFNGQWYHAYHNRAVSNAAAINTGYKRTLGIETLSFNADGTIQQVAYTTDGVPQVGHLDPYVRVEAETMNAQSGYQISGTKGTYSAKASIYTEPCSAGGMDVTQIAAGDWIKVAGVDFGAQSATSFTASVASTTSGGSIELHLTSPTGTTVGTCNVPDTGGAQTWMTTSCDVTGATGVQDLYLVFRGSGGANGGGPNGGGGGASLFNIDYWQFHGPGAASDAGASSSSAADTATNSGTSSTGGSSGGGSSGSTASGSRSGGATSQARSGTSEGAGTSSTSAHGATSDSSRGAESTSGTNSGCGCAVAGRERPGAGLGLGAVGLAFVRRRKRAASRSSNA